MLLDFTHRIPGELVKGGQQAAVLTDGNAVFADAAVGVPEVLVQQLAARYCPVHVIACVVLVDVADDLVHGAGHGKSSSPIPSWRMVSRASLWMRSPYGPSVGTSTKSAGL